jgi:hypothetical protein
MEKETSSLVSLGIVLIAIAVVITLGFGIFAVGKRLANNGQNDLVSQVDQINQSTFTDLDQQVITGTRLKGVINQLSAGNYAVLLNTLALRNNQADSATVTGDLATSVKGADTPYTIIMTNYPSTSAKGSPIKSTAFINYNALLKNGYKPEADVFSAAGGSSKGSKLGGLSELTDVTGIGKVNAGTCGGKDYDPASDNKGSYKTLVMTDGIFKTDLEFISDATTGNIEKNTKIADFTKQGTTMFIADAAQFNSYCIKDSTDNYVGLAFVQIKK